MKKQRTLNLVDTIEDSTYGEPSIYQIYLDKDSNIDLGWYYNDLFVKRGDVMIYRSFDASRNALAEVQKDFEPHIDEFIERHDLPVFAEIEVKDEIKWKGP